MKKPLRFFALGLISLTVSTESSRSGALAAAAPPETAPSSARSAARPADKHVENAAAKPISLEEATRWGAALQRVVRVQDIDTFNMLVDWDALVEKATALPGNSPQLKKFRTSFGRELKAATVSPRSGFGRAVMGAVEASGDYKPLRIHQDGGQMRVLFRLVSSNGALNYHDWVLGRATDGKTVATDCYVFLIGEMYSQNLRRSFLPLAQKSGSASVETLSGPEKDFVATFGQFAQMGRFVRERNWRQALNTYKELPASVQASKPAMTMRLLATQSVSDADYLATIDDFRKRYPNDPMIDLISVDAYILRKAYDKALESIDRVDKAIGGDPYLKVLRGNVLLRERKLDAARDMAQDAIAQEPNLLRGYYALLDISLARRDYADTVKWLKKAESLGASFGDLTGFTAFADFVKSPEYKSWLKTHAKKG
jgi:hypothetical protein